MATDASHATRIVLGHAGEIDTSRLAALELRCQELEQTVDKLCRTAAAEHDRLQERIRELELAS